jgi:hypothetical protein
LEIFVELVLELVLQIAGEALVELGIQSARNATRRQGIANPLLATLGYLVLGFLVGWLSALFWARRIIDTPVALANLVATPILVGLAMWGFGS